MSLSNKMGTGTCYMSACLNLLGIDWIEQLGLWNVPLASVCNTIAVTHLPTTSRARLNQNSPNFLLTDLVYAPKQKFHLPLNRAHKGSSANDVRFHSQQWPPSKKKLSVNNTSEFTNQSRSQGSQHRSNKKEKRQNSHLRRLFHRPQRRSRAEQVSAANIGSDLHQSRQQLRLLQN